MEPLDLGELGHPEPVVREPAPRGRRRLVAALVALALVVAGAAWWFDQGARDEEAAALSACDEQARAATQRADQVMAAMEQYLTPAFGFTPEGPERDSLYAILAREASRVTPGLADAEQVCAAVDVLPLHRGTLRQRDAYVDYLAARRDSLEGIAEDGERFFVRDEALARLREAAFG